MTQNKKLPETRFGAGLLTKLSEDAFVLPVRDAGAPSQPMRIDGQMGIKEKDESIEEAQAREGTEETVFVKEGEASVEIGVPETIRDTDLEYNLIRTYRNARRDEESPLPEAEGVFYFEASQKVGGDMPITEAESEGYKTGYTWEGTEDISMELMNDHEVDFTAEEVIVGDIAVYDIEHMETEEGVIHFDRPTAVLEPTEDRIAILRGGEVEYRGDVEGFKNFLSEEYGWNTSQVDTPATAKVQARLDAYDKNLGPQTSQELINDEYMNALEELGESFQDLPAP